jgi:hypothetical protein
MNAANLRSTAWSSKLATASQFVRSGDIDYLAAAEATGRAHRIAIERTEERLKFDFKAAAEYVAVKGTGIGDINRQITEKRVENERLGKEIEKLNEELPSREAELGSLKTNSAQLERAALALYQVAVKPIELSLEGGGDPVAAAHFGPRLARISTAMMDADGFPQAIALYEEIAAEIESYNLPTAQEEIRQSRKEETTAKTAYTRTLNEQTTPDTTPFDESLLHQVGSFADSPAEHARLLHTVELGIQRETETHEKARIEEQRSRTRLVELLRGLAITAGENLRTMVREMAPPRKDTRATGAGFEIEAEIAPESEIDRVLTEIIDDVERKRKRYEEDREGGGEADERGFQEGLSTWVRSRIYERMFPGARIKVVHPLMRGGRPFHFVKEGISGGQATALMLLWTIKLASYWIARAAAKKRGAARRKLRDANHSIIIVDGLFSDLSDPPLIRQSMEAMKAIRGGFQLIGLIHSPYYRIDWELFPTWLVGRRVSTSGEDGVEGKMVTIQSVAGDRAGRVSVNGLRARSTLASNEEDMEPANDDDPLDPDEAAE